MSKEIILTKEEKRKMGKIEKTVNSTSIDACAQGHRRYVVTQ